MGWYDPDEVTRTAFGNLVNDQSAQQWVAAHVRREFPRLACGAVWIDANGELHILALPNSSAKAIEKWSIAPELIHNVDRNALQHQGELVGFFSTRAPGKAALAEEISPAPACFWVISVDSTGQPLEHRAFAFDDWLKDSPDALPIASGSHARTPAETLLGEQSAIIATCVQSANHELMEWLRKHPQDLRMVHPGTFELVVAEIFRDQGYEVEVLGSWNQADGGIDIIAIRKDTTAGHFRVGIQCKRYVKTNIVRADLVWALEGRLEKFHLHKGVIATTARFEASILADVQSHLWRVEMKDFERLSEDLQGWGRYRREANGLWLPVK